MRRINPSTATLNSREERAAKAPAENGESRHDWSLLIINDIYNKRDRHSVPYDEQTHTGDGGLWKVSPFAAASIYPRWPLVGTDKKKGCQPKATPVTKILPAQGEDRAGSSNAVTRLGLRSSAALRITLPHMRLARTGRLGVEAVAWLWEEHKPRGLWGPPGRPALL